MPGRLTVGRKRLRAVHVTAGRLLLVVLVAVLSRVSKDTPHLAAGTMPTDAFDRRYVAHPWLSYLHITAGVLYLFLAPLQLSYRVRSRHHTFHRRLGRVLASAAVVSGIFALIFGGLFSFGGFSEAAATVVFSVWFIACVACAVRAVRRDDIVDHRRWMIRAFAIGIGIGTIRIAIGVFQGFGLLDLESSFGPALWISFSLHAVAAELWLRAFPDPPEITRASPSDVVAAQT